ncbi:Ser-Thr-rich glycosyl-phosphatidyl-inositol-anchored membrane family-domain-containing protein [Daldinia caldariorum]|uniref:Ser-Thr-rich glycosyl-phosphatidyl-inositol-anchored membrane family-domain-containing protein n=1 Tax=Daldinia caldariorum TaxID=326644 RepID=UPI00200726E1|nr:Ser-Thr-rich glycosyl-phosphatidyl-inositol-anchored membrane family-domain-containing protein [Daldinia caldariorum]KAI1468621.1 Ser-Thr-rich glycosyl-phosphatidyl-inositol-anchored membrane family-domain-containing protein [Daldinia caldariorum]
MRSTVFASALAFAASAFAQTPGYAVISSPAEGQQVPSGKTFTIKWDAGKDSGPVTITLLGGETPTTLSIGPVLATVDVSEGSFTWNVDCSLGKDKTYGIKVASVANPATFQYSFPFAIAGPSCGAVESSSSSSSSSSAVVSIATSTAGGYPVSVATSTAGGYPTQGSSTPSSSSVATSSVATSSVVTSSAPSSTAPSYPTLSVSSSVKSSSSVASNTTSAKSTPNPTYSVVVPSGNLSTTHQTPTYVPTTIVTSASYAVVTPTQSGSPSTSAPVTIPTAGASNIAAGSLALFGGLAFALFGM